MDTAQVRASLLERAWELQDRFDMKALVDLLAPVPIMDLADEPELGLLLGFGWFHTGSWTEALQIVQVLSESTRKNGTSRLSRRIRNLNAMILLAQGALGPAEELWLELYDQSEKVGDPITLAWATTNLAIIADIQCRWEDALTRLQRAGAAYQRLGDRNALGATHHNLGMAYRQLGMLHDANRHFERAADLYRGHANENAIAGTELERGLTLYLLGDFRLGTASVNGALQRFTRLGHTVGQCDARRVLGIFAIQEDRFGDARRLLETGLARVREAVDKITEAEILEELAVLEKLEGNQAESARWAEEASRIYRGVGADRRADNFERRLSDMSDRGYHQGGR